MDPEPEVIHQQIDETRESLASKLETLEGQVKQTVSSVTETFENVKSTVEDTIEGAKARVEDTVEAVKSSVHDTVETVKKTLDLKGQVERHPWGVMGCSLLAGAAVGYLLSGRRHTHFAMPFPATAGRPAGFGSAANALASETQPDGRHRDVHSRGGLTEMLRPFEGELSKLKGLAIGAMAAVTRDVLKRSLPPALSPHVDEIMNGVARHAGGEPIREPILPDPSDESSRPASSRN